MNKNHLNQSKQCRKVECGTMPECSVFSGVFQEWLMSPIFTSLSLSLERERERERERECTGHVGGEVDELCVVPHSHFPPPLSLSFLLLSYCFFSIIQALISFLCVCVFVYVSLFNSHQIRWNFSLHCLTKNDREWMCLTIVKSNIIAASNKSDFLHSSLFLLGLNIILIKVIWKPDT